MAADGRTSKIELGARTLGEASGGDMLALAIRHLQAGNLSEAERLYRWILQRSPQHADALNLLGVTAVQQGKPDEAIAHIGRALRINPANATFHYNLALAHQAAGDREAAILNYQRAAALKSDYFDALSNLGSLLLNTGETEEAESSYRRALRLAPANAMAHHNLGALLLVKNSNDEAAACFREAVRLNPDYFEAHNGLGTALLAEELFDEAAPCFNEALRLRPIYARAHNNLGMALAGLGRFEPAVASFRAAVRHDPSYAGAHNNLGKLLFEQDRLEEAEASFREVLQFKPDDIQAHLNLAKLLLEQDDFDAALVIYQKALDLRPGAVNLLAAKAGALQRKGDFDAAYAIVHPLIDQEPVSLGVATVFGELSRRYNCREEAVALLEKTLAQDNLPLEARRTAHFALGKLYDDLDAFEDAFRHYAEGNALRPTPFDPDRAAARMDRWLAHFSRDRLARLPRARNDSELPVFIIGMPRSGTSLVEQILACHPAVFGAGELRDITRIGESLKMAPFAEDSDCAQPVDLDQEALDTAAERHLERLRALGGDALRVTDKMPYNYLHLPLIWMLFPRARVIHCARDPLDTCLSCYFQNFARGNFQTFDLRHAGLYYKQYEKVMEHWRATLDMPLLEVRYEEHVAEPERVCRAMLDFLGLEWDARCLGFHESKRVVKTASRDQVRQPIYTRSAGRWRHYEHHLGPLKEAFGRRP